MDMDASGFTLKQRFTQLQTQVVAMATAQGGANAAQKGFPDAPIFDGSKAEELHTWIIQLHNELAMQPHLYPDDQVCLRYTFNHLLGAVLNLIHVYVPENNRRILLKSLNVLIDLLRQTFDDPDRTRTTNREIWKLKQNNSTFSLYFAEFDRIMEELNWNEEVQREQLYVGLSDEIKDDLVTSCSCSDRLGHLIQICREVENRIRPCAVERVQPGRTQQLPHSAPSSASAPAPAPANPMGTNSGHYGVVPMDLSAT